MKTCTLNKAYCSQHLTCSGVMELDHCLKLLRNAKTDNEKMAALMLAAKLVNSGDIGAGGRKKVFDAVGFSFINRLLATSRLPEGCTENPYHKVAITILACFCTDSELVAHPQITSKIPTFNHFILEQSPVESDVTNESQGGSIASESLQCLQALSSSEIGVLHLLKHKTPESLARVVIARTPAVKFDAAKDLLLYILGHSAAQNATDYSATVSDVLSLLAREFRASQDELKFSLCDVLYSILSISGDVLIESDESVPTKNAGWLADIASGLQAILTSRIDPDRKNKALSLAAVLVHLLGVNWAVQTDVKFFMIVVNLVSVELRMATEDQDAQRLLENSALLCSYFIILESSVVFVCQQSDLLEAGAEPGSALSQGELTQMHTTLTEAFACVIRILHCLRDFSVATDGSDELATLIMAAVRVLGAWLAEETLALSSDVYRLLPFLVDLCRGRLSQGGDEDLLKFLLPGLSHLSAEDKPRKILLESSFQDLMLAYMQYLEPLYLSSSEFSGRLALCCEVMMNVCITESEAVENDKTFTSIAVLSLQIVNESDCSRLSLSAALLSLLITRRQGFERVAPKLKTSEDQITCWCRILQLLLNTVKQYPALLNLSAVSPSVQSQSGSSCLWSDVSELWFLAMQELTALAGKSQTFKDALLQTVSQGSLVQEFTDILKVFVEFQEDDEESQSISTSICSLLSSMTSSKLD